MKVIRMLTKPEIDDKLVDTSEVLIDTDESRIEFYRELIQEQQEQM